ncbi:MAG: DUF1801 domain-containing protein [Anaerolineaceae bacterium]
MTDSNPKVDAFIQRERKWQEEYKALRSILHAFPLTEELKWGVPTYTFQNSNVVLMHGFKEYCALLFPKGVLLKDPAGILIQQTQNVQAARQVRFTNLDEIIELEPVLKAYIAAAIEVEKSGQKVEKKQTADFTVAEEFQCKLDADPNLKAAFEALTPGRQRAYLLYFSSPKLAKTREARVEQAIPRILEGKGLND